jgi:hypothetical protein
MKIIAEPPFETWGEILHENVRRRGALSQALNEAVVSQVRGEVVRAALSYTAQLRELAGRVGLTISMPPADYNSTECPIVMAGHQPVIYHPGLLFKNQALSRLVAETKALGINVIVDTDIGDAGRMMWPVVSSAGIGLREASISSGGGLYRDQRVKLIPELDDVFRPMISDLRAGGLTEQASRAERVAELYRRLAGENIVIANSLVRWSFETREYLEVPLSQILVLSVVSRILQELAAHPKRFVEIYNSTLDQYRAEHRIKNPANPFPNMKIDQESLELPLWEIVGGERRPVLVPQDGVWKGAGGLLAPRGSIVTFLLRGYCSDLFVHGLGGAKYDRFVDAFASAMSGVTLPKYVAASRTTYLFPEQVQRYERARELKSRYKEMVSHTQKFFDQGLFSAEDEARLRPMVNTRQELLRELESAGGGEARSAVAHKLNALNREIKETIDTSAVAPILADAAIDEATFSRWACREFPFFFFER